jgi:hypothetical protein
MRRLLGWERLSWMFVGALTAFGVLGILSIGFPFLLLALYLGGWLNGRRVRAPGMFLFGAALLIAIFGVWWWLFPDCVGWVGDQYATHCVQRSESNPWPFAGAVVVMGVGLVRARLSRGSASAGAGAG